jgi:hypothetical protein
LKQSIKKFCDNTPKVPLQLWTGDNCWAFGNDAQGNLFDNLVPSYGPQLNPTWLVAISGFSIVAQLLAIGLVRHHLKLSILLINIDHGPISKTTRT